MNSIRRNNYLAASIALALAGTTIAVAQSTRTVGPQTDGSYVVSNNQTITPAGVQGTSPGRCVERFPTFTG